MLNHNLFNVFPKKNKASLQKLAIKKTLYRKLKLK